MWNQLYVFGSTALTKTLTCNSDTGIWEGISSNMNWKGWILQILPWTNSACNEEPCLVQEATDPVQFRLFECPVLCPWWKGFVYYRKRKVAFCFSKNLSTITPIINLDKGNGSMNLSIIKKKKKKIEREQIDKSLARLQEWKPLYVKQTGKSVVQMDTMSMKGEDKAKIELSESKMLKLVILSGRELSSK